MKYNPTPIPNLKIHPKTGIYYFVKGRTEISLKTTNLKEAKERKKVKEAERDGFGAESSVTVGALYPDYLEYMEKRMKGEIKGARPFSLTSFNEIKKCFKPLLKYFGNTKLSQVESKWEGFCEWSTVNDLANYRKVFNGFFKWAKKKKKLITKLPDITDIPYHKRRKRRIIKPKDLETIFSNAKGGLLLFLTLALYNGLRRSEIMTLAWQNVNLQDRYIVIADVNNKLRRERYLPINDIVVKVFKAHLETFTQSSPWVFPHREIRSKHASLGAYMTAWRTVLKRSELEDIQWHDFRSTFEKYMDKSVKHTDMQKQKFSDATKSVRERIYVTMDHEDLRGLEDSVILPAVETQILKKAKGPGYGKTTGEET